MKLPEHTVLKEKVDLIFQSLNVKQKNISLREVLYLQDIKLSDAPLLQSHQKINCTASWQMTFRCYFENSLERFHTKYKNKYVAY